MTSTSWLAFAAAFFSGAMAVATLFRQPASLARWCFFAGMATLALESAFAGISLQTPVPERVAHWQSLALTAMSFLPGFWLAFSLTYSRGNYREFLAKWRIVLAAAFLLPIGVALGFRQHLLHLLPPTGADDGWSLSFGSAGKALNVLCLIAAVMVVSNLEKTFRSTVGTMRWRIKFVVLGLAVIFAGRIYTLSQNVLYSGYDLTLTDIESGALLIGCAMMSIGYLRNGFAEIDVYPSPSLLQGTITVLLAGGYLFCHWRAGAAHRALRWRREFQNAGLAGARGDCRPGCSAALGAKSTEDQALRKPPLQKASTRFSKGMAPLYPAHVGCARSRLRLLDCRKDDFRNLQRLVSDDLARR